MARKLGAMWQLIPVCGFPGLSGAVDVTRVYPYVCNQIPEPV